MEDVIGLLGFDLITTTHTREVNGPLEPCHCGTDTRAPISATMRLHDATWAEVKSTIALAQG